MKDPMESISFVPKTIPGMGGVASGVSCRGGVCCAGMGCGHVGVGWVVSFRGGVSHAGVWWVM